MNIVISYLAESRAGNDDQHRTHRQQQTSSTLLPLQPSSAFAFGFKITENPHRTETYED